MRSNLANIDTCRGWGAVIPNRQWQSHRTDRTNRARAISSVDAEPKGPALRVAPQIAAGQADQGNRCHTGEQQYRDRDGHDIVRVEALRQRPTRMAGPPQEGDQTPTWIVLIRVDEWRARGDGLAPELFQRLVLEQSSPVVLSGLGLCHEQLVTGTVGLDVVEDLL